MSQSERPSPVQPPFFGYASNNMAQIHRPSGFPTTNAIGRQEHRHSELQLPPIQTGPQNPFAYDHGGRQVKLPPMQIPHNGPEPHPKAAATRSIPVAQLLTTNPPSPVRSHPPVAVQQSGHRSTPSGYHSNTPVQYRPQPLSHTLPPRLDQPMSFRHLPPQTLDSERYPFPQHPQSHAPYPEQTTQRQFSPAASVYSSPSYTHSEVSPRSSIGPQGPSSVSQKPRVSVPPPLNYNLSIRQQPAAARACGFGERDRRVIDPPPILELKITDRASGHPAQDPNAMLALHCTLLSPDGHDDETELPPAHPDMPSTRRLMGTLVASPYQAKDENGIAGTFFVFPDLSCRSPGKYRLRFKLLRVDPMNMTPGAIHGSVASMVTDVFSVYTAKDFPGMRASSALLKSLRRQGLNVGVKKGSEARKGKGGKSKKDEDSASSSEGEDDSDVDGGRDTSSGGVSPKTKARKKGKRRKRNE